MNDNPVVLKFVKMQAQGNSYVYFDFMETEPPQIDLARFASIISNKNFGIGSDGVVFLLPDAENDALIRIWNADGSEAELCGSALRSVMTLFLKKKGEETGEYTIRTKAGVVKGNVTLKNKGYEASITLNDIHPVIFGDRKQDDPVENLINVDKWIGLPVSVGNPHFVVIDRFQEYGADITSPDLIQRIGPMITQDSLFKEGVNLELVRIITPRQISVRVWERGSGETLACGSGACAAVFAGFHLGFLDTDVEVYFPAGKVSVSLDCLKNLCHLTGYVGFICEGSINLQDILK